MRPEKAGELFNKYADMVYRQCYVFLGSEKDCEDAVQEVFVRLLQSEPEFSCERDERSWLIVTACNYCKSLLRKAKYRKTASLDEVQEKPSQPEYAKNELLDAITRLPPRQREAVYLYYYEDYTAEKIARITGESASTIRSRLYFARKKLKKSLEGGNGDE